MCFVVPGHYGWPICFLKKKNIVDIFFENRICQTCLLGQRHVLDVLSCVRCWFTKFFITPLTLSRHHKLTASKTLPSRFTMKSTSLKSTLVICLSICRIVRKKCNLDVSGSKIRSQDQFKKKLDPVGSTVRYEMMKLCAGSV